MENSKYDVCLAQLSRELMKTPVGGKVLTISEFCENTNFARGTVQAAYMTIRDSESIYVTPRGRLGTFVEKKNYRRLCEFANVHFLNISVPLPYRPDYIALNMGIKSNLENKLNIPIMFTQTKSSLNRLDDLMNKKVHGVVISKYIALQSILNNYPITIIQEFDTSDKIGDDSVTNKMSEALEDLINQGTVNEETRKIHAENFEAHLQPINDMIVDLEIDEIKRKFNLDYIDTNSPQLHEFVMVIHNDNGYINQIIKEVMDHREISKVKSSVLNGELDNISY